MDENDKFKVVENGDVNYDKFNLDDMVSDINLTNMHPLYLDDMKHGKNITANKCQFDYISHDLIVHVEKIDASAVLPELKTNGSACMDLHSTHDVTLYPSDTKLVHTGLKFEMDSNTEALIRPRSGLAINHGITVLNSPGTIDSDYRGEVCVILHNTSPTQYDIKQGDRIAQVAFRPVPKVNLRLVEKISEDTDRGASGFGSTGK